MFSIRSDSVFKGRLFFANCFHICCYNAIDKIAVLNLRSRISFRSKQHGKILAAYLRNEMLLFFTLCFVARIVLTQLKTTAYYQLRINGRGLTDLQPEASTIYGAPNP